VTIASTLDSGADDYIVKPLTNEILIAHLNTLLRRSTRMGTCPQLAKANGCRNRTIAYRKERGTRTAAKWKETAYRIPFSLLLIFEN